jgi:hypothetical protein
VKAAWLLAPALAACATPGPAADTPGTVELRRIAGPPAACAVRVVGPTATQDFIERADGIALYALTARDNRTIRELSGNAALPVPDDPFPPSMTDGRPPLGTVLQASDQRIAVRLASPGTLRAMLRDLSAQVRPAGPSAGPSPDLLARFEACVTAMAPVGLTR